MKATVRRVLQPVLLPHWAADLALLVPRVVCGILLTREFGAAKFGLPWSDPDANLRFFEVAYWFPNDIAEFGGVFALAPGPIAWLAAFSEAVGGVAFVIGFASRVFAVLLLGTMLGAMFLQQRQYGLWNMLPALGFSWFAWYTLVLGAGRISVDHLLTRERA